MVLFIIELCTFWFFDQFDHLRCCVQNDSHLIKPKKSKKFVISNNQFQKPPQVENGR